MICLQRVLSDKKHSFQCWSEINDCLVMEVERGVLAYTFHSFFIWVLDKLYIAKYIELYNFSVSEWSEGQLGVVTYLLWTVHSFLFVILSVWFKEWNSFHCFDPCFSNLICNESKSSFKFSCGKS